MISEASFDMTDMALDRNQNQFKGDENLRVQFSIFPEFDQGKSDKEGRPIYNDATYVTIMIPGHQDVVHRKAWKLDYDRFPKQYAAFKNNQDQDLASGTPLAVLTWLQRSQIKELEYFNIRTVEHLAAMPDNTAGKFMGLTQLKQRAKDFIDAATKAAPLTAMRAELEERDARIEALQNQVTDMAARFEEAQEKKGKKAA